MHGQVLAGNSCGRGDAGRDGVSRSEEKWRTSSALFHLHAAAMADAGEGTEDIAT